MLRYTMLLAKYLETKQALYTLAHTVAEKDILQAKNKGLQRALDQKKKQIQRRKPLFSDLPHNAQFFSPTKIQEARDEIHRREVKEQGEKIRKEAQQLERRLARERKAQLKEERQRAREEARIQRQEAQTAKKQQRKETLEQQLASLQLQGKAKYQKKYKTKAAPALNLLDLEAVDLGGENSTESLNLLRTRSRREIRAPQRFRQ